jgi:hypothetical protein
MMHESFHRVQPDLGIPLAMPHNHHLDSGTGRLWIRLEWRALLDAMARDEPLKSDALTDAFVFRAFRHSLFEHAAEEERQLELNEGLAEYTGLRLGGLEPEQQRAAAISALRGYERSSTLVRSFAYACGPVYGRLLDDAMPGWHRRVRKNTDLVELLQSALDYRAPKNLEDEAVRRAAVYDYDVLLAEESQRELAREDRLAQLRARYVDHPVLAIDLIGEHSYSFLPHDVHALDDIGTVYGGMRISGPWGILDAPGGALRIETARGVPRIVVPAPLNTDAQPIRGDGWILDLKPGWRLGPGPRAGDFLIERAQR